jgi:uncharacterized protein
MLISRDKNKGSFEIREYESGRIVINDETYYHSVIVSPTHLIDDWRPQHLDELTVSDFDVIYSLNPEVFLLGTGTALLLPESQLLAGFYKKNIGIEVMNTSAACRTFNVLMSESRNAVAALFLR